MDFCNLKLEEGFFYSAIRLDKTNLFLSRILRTFHNQFSMGKFLKRNEASSSGDAAQTASKNSNGIIKGRVSQRKNVLEMDEGIEY